MKKAFTLIELLVVIAIIAILAAILFPVFAQAKVAAKKTVAISNQKQIGLGFVMYNNDNDDRYPMRSGCEQGSSINPALTAPALQGAPGSNVGCTGKFYNSMTWQTWQKYIAPYVKNVDLYNHPLRTKDATQWNDNGQILNAFAVNLGLTGASTSGFTTTPWTGGTQSGIPNVSSAMLLMELPHSYAAPLMVDGSVNNGVVDGFTQQTGYNLAVREYWRAILLKNAGGMHHDGGARSGGGSGRRSGRRPGGRQREVHRGQGLPRPDAHARGVHPWRGVSLHGHRLELPQRDERRALRGRPQAEPRHQLPALGAGAVKWPSEPSSSRCASFRSSWAAPPARRSSPSRSTRTRTPG